MRYLGVRFFKCSRRFVLQVTGLPENVERARREIETHIYTRTGNLPLTNSAAEPPPACYGPPQPAARRCAAQAGLFAAFGNDFHLNGNESAFNGELRPVSVGTTAVRFELISSSR